MASGKAVKNVKISNWSQTFSCQPELFFVPNNVDDIREIILLAKENHKTVRVIGSGHSPSDISLTNDYLISLRCFNRIIEVNENDYTIKTEAGILLADLNEILLKYDLAIPVLGSASDISVAGAINVATHGTGIRFNVLSNYVQELELVNSCGDIIKCSWENNTDIFLAALCGLGCIGIIINIKLKCERSFLLHQQIYPSTLDDLLEDLQDNLYSSDHFRFLWFPHTDNVSVWHSKRIYNSSVTKYSLSEKIFNWIINYGIGYYLLEFAYYISINFPKIVPYINRFFFRIVYNRKVEKTDLGYKIFNFECLFKQYVNEWSIPIEHTAVALAELRRFIETSEDVYVHFPVEVRFVKADEIYLSPAFGRDSCYINIIMYRAYGKDVEHSKYWRKYEEIMKSLGGRPHWAKAHSITAVEFIKMYPYFRAWVYVRKRMDPMKIFCNNYMDRILETMPSEDGNK